MKIVNYLILGIIVWMVASIVIEEFFSFRVWVITAFSFLWILLGCALIYSAAVSRDETRVARFIAGGLSLLAGASFFICHI